ncbi:hypothetical protein M9H77_28360 [Catharanthus roseus]|uniref:Uncharacterized protein n=1 Tax=Catharanthus roseus TaxID=4058 RepID=A0ACC0AHS6_CATRO|nr:hypothetical protein M9H77_28360 [Catharanthus roseus]
MHYLWTIPPHHVKEGIHILVEFEHIQQHSILITHDRNMTEHITAVTQMVSDEPSMLYTTVNNDDDEVDGSDGDDVVFSQSQSDDDNDSEKGEFQTPLNPVNPVNLVTKNIDLCSYILNCLPPRVEIVLIVAHIPSTTTYADEIASVKAAADSIKESCPNGRAVNGSATLDMGSGSPIDNLVESGTIRLLNWSNSMTDIQLGMRFIDKVQAISADRKWSISVGRKYRVVKVKLIHGPQDVTITITIITVHGTSV